MRVISITLLLVLIEIASFGNAFSIPKKDSYNNNNNNNKNNQNDENRNDDAISSQPSSSLPVRVRKEYRNNKNDDNNEEEEQQEFHKENQMTMTRQDWIQRTTLSLMGAVAYGKLVGDTVSRVARGNIYPSSHETRVADTIAQTLWTAAAAANANAAATSTSNNSHYAMPRAAQSSSTLRVLEVGLGSECRLLKRGLYQKAFQGLQKQSDQNKKGNDSLHRTSLHDISIDRVELVGLDLHPPSDTLLRQVQQDLDRNAPLPVEFMVVTGDIADPPTSLLLSSSSSTSSTTSSSTTSSSTTSSKPPLFDAIICCFTLCSVVNPELAVQQIKTLLRPDGGCFGYIEHVAALPSDTTTTTIARTSTNNKLEDGFLDWQQQTLDPLQQVLADNCHLHRRTDEIIDSVFQTTTTTTIPNTGTAHITSTTTTRGTGTVLAQRLTQERFLVSDMWPVAMQSRGIIQQITIQ